MDTKKMEAEVCRQVDDWIEDIRPFSYEQLVQQPSSGSWSLGQLGIHLWMSAKGFFFKNAERCLRNENAERGKRKNGYGLLVFAFGSMPAIKIKMPAKVAVEPRAPESKEQLIQRLTEIKHLFADYAAQIADSNPDLKTHHPLLGWLNAAEWLELHKMHWEHHLAQKRRIKRHFGWK